MVPILSLIGAFLAEEFRKRTGVPTKRLLLFFLLMLILVAVYILIGFIPGITWGFVHEFELYVVGGVFGIVVGTNKG